MCNVLTATLFGVDFRRLLDYTENEFGGFASLGYRWQLGKTDSCANRSYENYVAACEDLLGVESKAAGELCSNVKNHGNEYEADAL